jgi:hypothetical protein
LQRHRGIARIEKTIKLRAACLYAPRRLYLADFVLLHRLLNLPGQGLFQHDSAGFFQDAFFFQEVLQRRADALVALFYLVTSFILRLARARSSAGVLRVFLMSLCSTMSIWIGFV